MSFERFTKKRQIKKVIDPGQSLTPPAGQSPLGPNTITAEQEVKPISFRQRVDDLIAAAERTRNEIDSAIRDIVSRNQSDPVFKRYMDLVEESFFDPRVLLEGERIPGRFTPAVELKTAERNVLRRMTDPRAGFLHDLRFMRYEVDSLEYVARRVWRDISEKNTLYDEFNESTSALLSINKDIQYLRLLRFQAKRYKDTPFEKVARCVIESFTTKLQFKVSASAEFNPDEVVHELRKTVRTLKSIRAVLKLAQIKMTSDEWLDLKGAFLNSINSFAADIGAKVLDAHVFSVTNGIAGQILDFVDDITNALDVPCLDTTLFSDQIYGTIFKYKMQVEDVLLKKETRYINANKVRSLLYQKANEINKNKQLLAMIDKLIKFLSSLEVTIYSAPQLFSAGLAAVAGDMEKTLDEFFDKISVESV